MHVAPAKVFLGLPTGLCVGRTVCFVLAWGLPRRGRKNSVICLLILPLFTTSWRIFRGAPKKSLYGRRQLGWTQFLCSKRCTTQKWIIFLGAVTEIHHGMVVLHRLTCMHHNGVRQCIVPYTCTRSGWKGSLSSICTRLQKQALQLLPFLNS